MEILDRKAFTAYQLSRTADRKAGNSFLYQLFPAIGNKSLLYYKAFEA
jgi:hypothetical protein